jgi:hypothetical protein
VWFEMQCAADLAKSGEGHGCARAAARLTEMAKMRWREVCPPHRTAHAHNANFLTCFLLGSEHLACGAPQEEDDFRDDISVVVVALPVSSTAVDRSRAETHKAGSTLRRRADAERAAAAAAEAAALTAPPPGAAADKASALEKAAAPTLPAKSKLGAVLSALGGIKEEGDWEEDELDD